MGHANAASHRRRVAALRIYFSTVKVQGIRIESDGRAGDGMTHWRAIYRGSKLVGSLQDCSGHVSVTVAVKGDLRKGIEVKCDSLSAALHFAVARFSAKGGR